VLKHLMGAGRSLSGADEQHPAQSPRPRRRVL